MTAHAEDSHGWMERHRRKAVQRRRVRRILSYVEVGRVAAVVYRIAQHADSVAGAAAEWLLAQSHSATRGLLSRHPGLARGAASLRGRQADLGLHAAHGVRHPLAVMEQTGAGNRDARRL